MKTRIAPALAILLLLLVLACQRSDQDIGQVADERIAAALAAVPTITPQPRATVSAVKIEATIESLIGRLATAEAELVAQKEEFQAFLDGPDVDVIPDEPLQDSTVTTAMQSPSGGVCWIHRLENGGNGNTFLVEWDILEETGALCVSPFSPCAEDAQVGGPLPQSCRG